MADRYFDANVAHMTNINWSKNWIDKYDFSHLRTINTGAAITPLELKKRLLNTFKHATLNDNFGQTETTATGVLLSCGSRRSDLPNAGSAWMRRHRGSTRKMGRDGESGRRFETGWIAHRTRSDRLLQQDIASYKKLTIVEFVDALPRNASGKLLKYVLKE